MKKSSITATYRMNEAETLQVTVRLATSYPDALSEAKATAIGIIHEMLTDVMAQTRSDSEEA